MLCLAWRARQAALTTVSELWHNAVSKLAKIEEQPLLLGKRTCSQAWSAYCEAEERGALAATSLEMAE